MMTTLDHRELERLSHWQGEKLLSRDFNDQVTNDAHRRWWHNRSLHDAYGVVSGFDVIPVANGKQLPRHEPTEGEARHGEFIGNPNEILVGTKSPVAASANHQNEDADAFKKIDYNTRQVPSLAYDAFGREIVLPQAAKVPLPPLRSGEVHVLFLSSESVSPASYGSPCSPAGAQRPSFHWQKSANKRLGVPGTKEEESLGTMETSPVKITDLDFDIKSGIPLAAVRSHDKQHSVLYFQVPTIRPSSRPFVWSGETVQGKTNWQEQLVEPIADGRIEVVVTETTVDTSAAEFAQVPNYLAWLGGADGKLIGLAPQTIRHAARDHFLFQIFSIRFPTAEANISAGFGLPEQMANNSVGSFEKFFVRGPDQLEFARQNLYVSWIAVRNDNYCFHGGRS